MVLGLASKGVSAVSSIPFRIVSIFPLWKRGTEGYPPNVPIAKERLEPLGENNIRLNELLQGRVETEISYWTLAYATRQLEGVGFEIVAQEEEYPETEFKDIGQGGLVEGGWVTTNSTRLLEKRR